MWDLFGTFNLKNHKKAPGSYHEWDERRTRLSPQAATKKHQAGALKNRVHDTFFKQTNSYFNPMDKKTASR